MIRYFTLLFFALTSLMARAGEALPSELPPAQEASVLRSAEDTGLAIYRHDKATAIATDAILKIPAARSDKRVKGWVTEEKEGSIAVTFVDQTPAALYRATVSNSGEIVGDVVVHESPQALTSYEAGALKARSLALASDFQRCAEKYNTVVLPLTANGIMKWAVYLLPGTTQNDLVPIGGTYRVESDDNSVNASRGYTRTCIALKSDPKAIGLLLTHLLDSTPTEVHVFWSLWAHKPMYISTPPNGTIWIIENGKIRLVERGKAKG